MHYIKIIKTIFILLILCNNSFARVIEERIEVPVLFQTTLHGKIEKKITVSIFRDDSIAKAPFLLWHHGRGPGTDKYKVNWSTPTLRTDMVGQGFVVIAPIGYGYTPGEIDVENVWPEYCKPPYTGGVPSECLCNNANYIEVGKNIAEQSKQVLNHVFNLNYNFIDKSKGIVAGQSRGGFGTIAVIAENIPNIKGGINFAGGQGGFPDKNPGKPCGPLAIQKAFKNWGAKTKVPSLWLYSLNDNYWGEKLPKEWFSAYQEAGGKGRMISYPPYKSEGHFFGSQTNIWQSDFEKFIKEIGF